MDKEIKAQWVAALRSGEYSQTTGRLASEKGRHCCLGVLCELAVKAGLVEKTQLRDKFGFGNTRSEMESGVLPVSVMIWAGLHGTNPSVGGSSLAELNDGGASFSRIADLIETQL